MVCGNLVEPLDPSQPKVKTPKAELYAGGIDGVSIRGVLRKAAAHQWSLGTIDVKTAFLLAPRRNSRRLLLTRPPRLLIDNNLCRRDEVWEIAQAMYGLESSPADWAVYRDRTMRAIE